MVKSTIFLSLIGLTTLSAAAPTKRGSNGKRGVSFNDAGVTKLFAGKPQFSWCYNWEATPKGDVAAGLEYVAMLHDAQDVFTSGWDDFVKVAVKDKGAKHILSFNEPDQCGGGGTCMTDPGYAAAMHKKWVQPIADKYPNVKIGMPGVTNSDDPAKGISYLQKFIDACDGCRFDFAVAHWYAPADMTYFKDYLNKFHDAVKMPVWLSEFAAQGGDIEGFLGDAMGWMDGQDWIQRYAYQYAAPGVLVDGASTGLTPLGKVYASA